MLERQLLELAVTKLTELAKMLNQLSQGFLNIQLHKDIARSLHEAISTLFEPCLNPV